jgi:hypothetical protein
MDCSSNASQVDLELHPQPLTSIKCQTQPVAQLVTHPVLSTPLESSDTRERQSPQPPSHIHPRFAILSHLRHIAGSRSHVVESAFEDHARQLFRRENAPSPEPRPECLGPEPTASQQAIAEEHGFDSQSLGGNGILVDKLGQYQSTPSTSCLHASNTAEPINPIAPRSGGTDSDARSQPETLIVPIKDAPAADPIAVLDADVEQNDDLLVSLRVVCTEFCI